MNNMLAGILAGALLVIPMAIFAQDNAGPKQWRTTISENGWTKDAVIEWKERGFGLVANPPKKFGWVESTERLPFVRTGKVTLTVEKLEDANTTVQVQTFDDQGRFIEAVDVIKEMDAIGERTVSLDKFVINEKTAQINFKIWIGSGKGTGLVQFKDILYQY